MWMAHLTVLGQTDGYDPSNPPNPNTSEKDTTHYYALTVKSVPDGIGSFNILGGKYAEGKSVYLYAYSHDNCTFKRWIDEDGQTLSTNYSLYYTMPARDVVVTAVYEYNPSNPGNPDAPQIIKSHQLNLVAKPTVGGYFNLSGGSATIKEGDSYNVYAYCNSNFVFLRWENEAGETVSNRYNYTVTMGDKDVTYYAIFDYRPDNPGNPGSNSWDSQGGELIIDDFNPGYAYSVASSFLDKKGVSSTNVTSIILAGKANNSDAAIAQNFSNCTFLDLSRTSGITSVPSWCYSGNSMLTQVYLPSSVQSIEYCAFNNCTALSELTCLAVTPPSVGNNAFAGVPAGMVVRVPEASIEFYEALEAWSKFQILPIMADVHKLELNLPDDCSDGRYKNMSIELVNIKSGQKYKYVVTDRLNYIFGNLMKNTTYNAYLKNLSGVVLAQIDSVKIENQDRSLSFSNIKSLRTVSLCVLDVNGGDVTSKTSVKWYDETGKYLGQNYQLEGQVENSNVRVSVTLNQELGMQYVFLSDSVYSVQADENQIVCQLQPIPMTTLKGDVYDVTTGMPLAGAIVTVTQAINGLYPKAYTAKTDNLGSFQMQVFKAPSVINYNLNDYISQTVELTDSVFANGILKLEDVKLKSVAGVRIALNYTYQSSVQPEEEATLQNWYTDYSNVSYTIYNKTAKKAVREFNVQYPTIVLLEEVAEGDILEVTAASKTKSFMPVKAEGQVDATNNMSVTLPIVQLGGIKASFSQTENIGVVSMLYDAKGNLLGKYTYNSAVLTINNLTDGSYKLITMGKSNLFNSFSNLNSYDEAELVNGVDYICNDVDVKSGIFSMIKNVVVPFFDESKFYYTGENTLFSVNKSSVVAGNYLTLQAKLDFKSIYRDKISNVELLFPMPDGVSFVNNSMLVGSQLSVYQVENGTVSVSLGNDYEKKIRFCVVPVNSGVIVANAFVRFKYGENTIVQPIGTANCKVEDLKISVPSIISSEELIVKGVAQGKSNVTLYDGSDIIGSTIALANGSWTISSRLVNPYNLSVHPIHAEVVNTDGNKIATETKNCEYDVNANYVKTVTMSFYNGWMHQNLGCVWDFEKKTTSVNSYSFYTATDFTFITDFANNSPDYLSDVKVIVYGSNGSKQKLSAVYDAKLNKWVASQKFSSSNLPINVQVSFSQTTSEGFLSPEYLSDAYGEFTDVLTFIEHSSEQVDSLKTLIDEELTRENTDFDYVFELYKKYHALIGLQEIPYTDGELMSDEEIEALKTQLENFKEQYGNYNVDELLKTALRDISYEGIDEENGISYKIIVSTCEGYNESDIDSLYQKINTIDGGCFYLKVQNDSYLLLDFKNDVVYEIFLTENDISAKSADNRDFAQKMEGYIKWIKENYDKAMDITKKALGVIDDVQKHIEAGIKFAQEGYGSAYLQLLRLQRLEKNGEFVNPIRKVALQLVCDGYEVELKGLKNLKNSVTQLSSKFYGHVFGAAGIAISFLNCSKDLQSFIDLYFSVPDPCKDDQQQADAIKSRIVGAGISAGLYYIGNISADVMSLLGIGPAVVSAPATAGSSLGVALAAVAKLALSYGIQKAYEKLTTSFKNNAKRDIKALKCSIPDDDNDDDYNEDDNNDDNNYNNDNGDGNGDNDDSPFEPIRPILDPSGYVYEGVESNRLQGVTATCYYKETVEDMYGDLHENIVLWDAEEYAQKNPLFTDENGMYAWDVPQGLWQVKFEKEGYQTTYSEWLPVPPPQLEVNIGMVQNAQPEVKSAKAYEDGVEIEFSKYMKPTTLTADNLYLKIITGSTEEMVKDVTVELLNVETVSEEDATQYVSKVAIKTTKDLGMVDEVYVIVNNKVESYAGIQMAETYSQRLDVEKKVREIVADETYNIGYEHGQTITVGALPNDASKGKTLMVKAVSNLIASIEAENATVDANGYTLLALDENGQASLTINGELFGTTALSFKMLDSDISAQSIVNVVDPVKLAQVKEAIASRISGTSVYRGQTVTLSCETEGATIYYTTDGSCPCDEATRIKYDGKPIVINGDVSFKIMAVGINGSESEVKEYSYTIKKTQLELNLAEGWNWASHNMLNTLSADSLRQNYVNRVLTQSSEVYNDPILGFVGNLSALNALTGIKVETKTQGIISLFGEQFNPNASIVELKKGWNWIGYPLDQTMSVAEALSKLEAEEGDCLTNLEGGYTNFCNGVWTGTLNTMIPGQGYLYKSASRKSFIYNDAIVSNAKAVYSTRLDINPAPWTVNVHNYPNMMCLTAELFDNGMRTADDEYFVAAFVGEECRGVGKYVGGKLYMAVYGGIMAGEQVVFRAVDRESGEQFAIQETLDFCADAVGSNSSPYVLNLGQATGITDVDAYPMATEGIYDVSGQKMKMPNTRGIYIVNGKKVLIK